MSHLQWTTHLEVESVLRSVLYDGIDEQGNRFNGSEQAWSSAVTYDTLHFHCELRRILDGNKIYTVQRLLYQTGHCLSVYYTTSCILYSAYFTKQGIVSLYTKPPPV